MSDHLTRLAARALGLAETVRPRRTIFEPQPAVLEPTSALAPEAERTPAASIRPADDAERSDPVVVSAESREETAVPEHIKQIAADELEPISAAPSRRLRREPVPARTDHRPSPPERGETGETAIARHAPQAVRPSQAPADPPAGHAAKLVTQRPPLLAPRTPQRSLPAEAEPGQPPTVRVTIGRVDVRAVAPEQAVERPPKPTPRMSLDEYLSRNRSGAR